MLSIIQAAGWPIWPLIAASIISLTIIGWHLWTFKLVAPKALLPQVQTWIQQGKVDGAKLAQLEAHSYLGQVFAAGLRNAKSSREVMQEEIEETGRRVAHEIEQPRLKYGLSFLVSLNTLGTIASVSPLLGLFGTVIGMVEIFGALKPTGGSPAELAHGISVALYNTAMGLIVAIPSMIFYRYFRARAEALVLEMEQQAIKLVQIVHGERK
ncbi:MAG: MotA/TolQ/ExbB proton channel family protein [Sulfuricella sp.]|nr:MotA/TolQ/ExbB proton channel family protein [Sulfuricella sp.]